MAGSAAEREIRDAVAAHLREQIPGARIIHELVVGGCRADLAAIGTETVLLVEIKSRKDKLTRFPEQLRQFQRASHGVIVVVDRKWFDVFDYTHSTSKGIREGGELNDALKGAGYEGVFNRELWPFPRSTPGEFAYEWLGGWKIPAFSNRQPHAWHLLSLLWRAELWEECGRARIAAGRRSTCSDMIETMAYHMTGREIAQAVCRQLRGRPFPEADPAIA